MEIAFEVCKLIKFSPKRNAAFNKIKAGEAEDDSISGIGIRSLCSTRWTVRGESVGSILESYILNQLWDECLEESLVPDVKGTNYRCESSNVRIQDIVWATSL